MKRIFFVVISWIVLLLSCAQSVPPAPAPDNGYIVIDTKWIYDSYWNLIAKSETRVSKDITVVDSGDIQAIVDAYKTANPRLGVFIEDAETPIEDAPLAVGWIVKPDTYEPIKAFLDVPRSDFVDRAALWTLEAQSDGGILFIDTVPPLPLPKDTTYQYYIYLIAADGSILFYDQYPADIFPYMLVAYYQQAYDYPGSTVVHGQFYPGAN